MKKQIAIAGIAAALAVSSLNCSKNPDKRITPLSESVSTRELAAFMVERAKSNWINFPVTNVVGKISATNYFFRGPGYTISVLVNKSGKIDGISYKDEERVIFDIPENGFGINSGVDAYIE